MSDDVQQFIDETENAEDLGALPWWTPTKKTPAIVGCVLEYRAIDTEYGRMRGAAVELIGQAVVQDGQRDEPRLADKGERVMIWQKNTVLRNAWTEPNSGGGPAAVGEVVGVKRTGERQGSRGKVSHVRGACDGPQWRRACADERRRSGWRDEPRGLGLRRSRVAKRAGRRSSRSRTLNQLRELRGLRRQHRRLARRSACRPGVHAERTLGVTMIRKVDRSLNIEPVFRAAIASVGLPQPAKEYRFHPTRRWRFDYAFPEKKVAVEVEGGVFIRGRHTRGAGFRTDLEKYSEAAALGWLVIRVLPEQLCEERTLVWIRRALARAA